jgi:hypothetical protein
MMASLVSIAVPVIILLVAYFALFVIAVFTNSGLGSPIALPLWAIFVIVVSILYTAVLLFPSTFIAEIITRSFGKWQHIAQIPLSTLVLLILVYALSVVVRLLPNYLELNFLHWANYPFFAFLVLSIPLGIYWWTMKAVQTGVSIPMVFFRKLRKPSLP